VPEPTLTPAIALAHERLTPRVAALLKQVERSAARHPEHPVPEATRAVAKSLFGEARKILGREAMRIVGAATANLSALSVGLGQLVAMLEAFEAEHSGFSAKAKCVVWRLAGPPLPVTRLEPPGVEAGPPADDMPESAKPGGAREQLVRLIMGRFAAGYDEGYRDAKEGRPPSSRYAEGAWEAMVKWCGGDEAARLRDLDKRYGTTKPPPHLMPIGALPGEWERIQLERYEIEKAERIARLAAKRQTE
jgi:hypothetical protein